MVLDFDDNIKSLLDHEWKWKKIDTKWENARSAVAAAMINDNKLICCGGDARFSEAKVDRKRVDIYNFKTNTMTKLSNMKNERESAGIYVDNNVYQRVYIGGGKYSSQKVEYYDIIKNKWTLLCDTNTNHKYWPILWDKNPNVIIIGSVHKKKDLFEQIDIRENKWKKYYINDGNVSSLYNIFGVKADIYKSDDAYNDSRLLFPQI